MNPSEISLLVVALVPLIYCGWRGWRDGATAEIRHLLVNLFGVLVAIRYWQPWTETVAGGLTFDPRWIAVSSFVLLYGIGAAVAGFIVKLKASSYRSVQSDPINGALGAVAGLFSGALLGAAVIWLATVALPGSFDSVEAAKTFAGWPRQVFQTLEAASGVAADSPALTRYPHVTLVDVPLDAGAGAAPEGAVLMQQRGQLAWR